jgi:nitroimidazol reductase NimA-like FMN-containing flavoprotein (pyridoxamine 5'-phosphate oxidase superfamily)
MFPVRAYNCKSHHDMRRNEKEITDITEIEAIISSADVCRIAMANDNIPYIVTLNFGYVGGAEKRLYFHCAREGRKLEMIGKNNYVCFEFDTDHNLYKGKTACDYGMKYRSVVGYGKMAVISDDHEKRVGLDAIMSHYSNDKDFSFRQVSIDKMLLLRLGILTMTGKKG